MVNGHYEQKFQKKKIFNSILTYKKFQIDFFSEYEYLKIFYKNNNFSFQNI